jgi:serine O-acetyltransferase
MLEFVREDLRRAGNTPRQQIRMILFAPGVWAALSYRFRRWVYVHRPPQPLRALLNLTASFVQAWTDMTTNIQIPASASIGPGLLIVHTGYVVLSATTVMGRNCTLAQGVTIGHAGGGSRTAGGSPVIGDRVYVGPGAALIGPITVGNDALIGVGAVVTHNVPPRGVVAGNPARLISLKGSFDLITYPGMEIDPARVAALAESPADPDVVTR